MSIRVEDVFELLGKISAEDFQGSEAIVEFIRFVDPLFDLLNARTPFGRGFKKPLNLAGKDCLGECAQ